MDYIIRSVNVNFIKEVETFIQEQSNLIHVIKQNLDDNTYKLVEMVLSLKNNRLFFTGVGKAGLTSKLIASTFTSLGLPSFFVLPTEFLHGELGLLAAEDLIILISKSGESEELYSIIPPIRNLGVKIVLITTNEYSNLASSVDIVVNLGIEKEMLLDGSAPSTSNLVFLIYFYALLSVIISERKFTAQDFSQIHPAGLIGKSLNHRITNLSHKGKIEYLHPNNKFIEVLVGLSSSGIGGVAIVDELKNVVGVITDGDIRRLLMKKDIDELFKLDASQLMKTNFTAVRLDNLSTNVFKLMREKRLSFVPVIDDNSKFSFSIGIASLIEEGFHD